jgi:undecaprenyl diphosphate synthase
MITENTLREHLFTTDIPDPDLVIRTGGEQRLSNFLLWQAAYAELYFTPILWPDFGEEHFMDALAEYAHRERRFGKIVNHEL